MQSADQTVRIGDLLDSQFALLRGEMEKSKARSLAELARVFGAADVPYAVTRGVAVQIWSKEPRTTLDVDVAVLSYDTLPRTALKTAGFVPGRKFAHSQNWTGSDGAPVQFTDDPAFAEAVRRPEKRQLAGLSLHLVPVLDLVRAKLRAAADPATRRSKRLMDLADACALTEQHPKVSRRLTPVERHQLGAGGKSR